MPLNGLSFLLWSISYYAELLNVFQLLDFLANFLEEGILKWS